MSLKDVLSTLPKLFTKTQSDTIGLAKISADGNLSVTATTPNNDYFIGVFDEQALQKMGASDFKVFIDQMISSFNENKCTSTPAANDWALDVPGCGKFILKKSPGNGHISMLDNILSFARLRASRDPDKLLGDVQKRAQEAMQKAKSLEREEKHFSETIEASREKIEYNTTRIKELQEELSSLEIAKKKAAAESGLYFNNKIKHINTNSNIIPKQVYPKRIFKTKMTTTMVFLVFVTLSEMLIAKTLITIY